jgi:uncharacterized phage protein gp47/JayE
MPSINYSNRDYESIKTDLLFRASALIPEWSSRDPSDFGMLLVDLWAYFADVLHYYVDRSAKEAFITTATQRESLLALASLFDYSPQLQTAATAVVVVDGSGVPANQTVDVPVNTVFVAPATATSPIVYFSSTASASASASLNPSIPVVEGQIIVDETVGTSNGLANQRFFLYYPRVIGDSVTVSVLEGPVVNGLPSAVEYVYINKLTDSATNSKVFTININAQNETEIVFGNGVNGKIPNPGQSVVVSYRHGVGASGNVGANRITQFQTSPSQYLSVFSSSAATGGLNAESLESLRVNIPNAFATQNRAVSLSDYKALVLNVGGVAKGTAEYSSGTVVVYAAPFVDDYLNYGSGSISVSSDLRNQIVSYYEPRQMIGASVTAASVINLTAVDITATVNVLDGFIANSVLSDVNKSLDNLFAFDNVFFNQTLSKGTIYRTIMDVAGVDYATLSLPSSETVSSGQYGLLKKGTFTITTVGGVTG